MKGFNWLSIIAILFFFLLSCAKQLKEKQDEPAKPEVQTYKSSIKSCNCIGSESDDYRIEQPLMTRNSVLMEGSVLYT